MSKHQQEDPWAGFVDVLSNILMVVIFLVVILGISIYAISQQITKAAVERAVKAERETQTKPDTPAPKPQADTIPPAPSPPPPTPVAQGTPPPPETKSEAARGAAGVYGAVQGLRVREADDLPGNTNLAVRSRASDSKSIEIASEEIASSTAPIEVKSSQAFLTLKFGRGGFKIDDAASKEIQAFLRDKGELKGGNVEIRAFAQSTVGSVSEARRIAYYRAMQTRSELIKTGMPAAKVELKLRESASPEELDVVRIFAKP